MSFDPRDFPGMLVVDTCSVWNILSSKRLSTASFFSRVTFCVTPAVIFECLYKKRKVTPEMNEMMGRLKVACADGKFPVQESSLEDLLFVSNIAPSRLSSGELSCIAVACEIPTLAVMTDERLARRFSKDRLGLMVETTPRLYGWLHFNRFLTDADHQDVIDEHEKYERRPLSRFFNEAYEISLQYRLMQSGKG